MGDRPDCLAAATPSSSPWSARWGSQSGRWGSCGVGASPPTPSTALCTLADTTTSPPHPTSMIGTGRTRSGVDGSCSVTSPCGGHRPCPGRRFSIRPPPDHPHPASSHMSLPIPLPAFDRWGARLHPSATPPPAVAAGGLGDPAHPPTRDRQTRHRPRTVGTDLGRPPHPVGIRQKGLTMSRMETWGHDRY